MFSYLPEYLGLLFRISFSLVEKKVYGNVDYLNVKNVTNGANKYKAQTKNLSWIL